MGRNLMGQIFPAAGRTVAGALIVAWVGAAGFGQTTRTSPNDEARAPAPVRSLHSMGKDWMVPLCPSHFHDSLSGNGIAGPQDRDVTRPTVRKSYPAAITQEAIAASGQTHIGNYTVIVNVVVDSKGVPGNLCLQKSSGYGLDAAATDAVLEYRFNPAKRDGKPVRIRIPVAVRFENPEIGTATEAGSARPAE